MILQLGRSHKTSARRFADVLGFINALTAINDGGEFKRSNKKIYPREPELKKENIDYSEGSLFDLGIKIIKSLIFSFMIKEMISHFR